MQSRTLQTHPQRSIHGRSLLEMLSNQEVRFWADGYSPDRDGARQWGWLIIRVWGCCLPRKKVIACGWRWLKGKIRDWHHMRLIVMVCRVRKMAKQELERSWPRNSAWVTFRNVFWNKYASENSKKNAVVANRILDMRLVLLNISIREQCRTSAEEFVYCFITADKQNDSPRERCLRSRNESESERSARQEWGAWETTEAIRDPGVTTGFKEALQDLR